MEFSNYQLSHHPSTFQRRRGLSALGGRQKEDIGGWRLEVARYMGAMLGLITEKQEGNGSVLLELR